MQKFVLASKSPRRRELLGRFIDDFKIIADDSAEISIPGELPEDMVKRLAKEKAQNVYAMTDKKSLVIAADTVVAYKDKILGKPKDEKDAYDMLSMLSGNTHSVYTGVAVMSSDKLITVAEETKVTFRSLTEAEIEGYIASNEPMDKAGAYGIQDLGALLVAGIEGDYFNVVGLPLCSLDGVLKREFGISLMPIK